MSSLAASRIGRTAAVTAGSSPPRSSTSSCSFLMRGVRNPTPIAVEIAQATRPKTSQN